MENKAINYGKQYLIDLKSCDCIDIDLRKASKLAQKILDDDKLGDIIDDYVINVICAGK